MSAQAVDVLTVLDSLLSFASTGVEADDPARQLIEAGHEARAAAAELIGALNIAVRQNEHDMLMTGDELRTCRAALTRCGVQS